MYKGIGGSSGYGIGKIVIIKNDNEEIIKRIIGMTGEHISY